MAGDERIRIVVCDPASAYRRGLSAALTAAGYATEEVDDVRMQPMVSGVGLVMLTVRSTDDWQALGELRNLNPDLRIVVLLVNATPDRHAEALRYGAHGVVAWEASPEKIVDVAAATLRGLTLLPTDVVHSIAGSGRAVDDPEWIVAREVEWLKLLARGVTMQQLAEKVGYSERALYRILQALYRRMRVSNRTEAILLASRRGLLDECHRVEVRGHSPATASGSASDEWGVDRLRRSPLDRDSGAQPSGFSGVGDSTSSGGAGGGGYGTAS